MVKRDIQKVIERSQPSMLLLHACEKSFNHSTSTKAWGIGNRLHLQSNPACYDDSSFQGGDKSNDDKIEENTRKAAEQLEELNNKMGRPDAPEPPPME